MPVLLLLSRRKVILGVKGGTKLSPDSKVIATSAAAD